MSKGGQWWEMDGDLHANVDNDNVTVVVMEAAEYVFRSAKWVKGGEKGGKSVLVEVVDGIEDGMDDGDHVVLGKPAFCEDAVKDISLGSKLKGEVALCARLEAKLDQSLIWVRSAERKTDNVGVVDAGEEVNLFPKAKCHHCPVKIEIGQRSGLTEV